MTRSYTLAAAGVSGAICVALGAMGAHALKNRLPQESLDIFETAVRYQFFHTLALVCIVLLSERISSKALNYASTLFIAGIILFSFSLYLLALRPVFGIPDGEMRWLGAVTPFGGISLIAGWLMLAYSGITHKKA